MNQAKIKPCKFCGSVKHFPYQCPKNPKHEGRFSSIKSPAKKTYKIPQKTVIKPIGKRTIEWLKIRRAWFKANPAEYYECKLRISPMCPKFMKKNETTLDHIIPKSNAANYANRHDFSNLQPACSPCNNQKGSKQ